MALFSAPIETTEVPAVAAEPASPKAGLARRVMDKVTRRTPAG
jgi:hypothetical protein